MASSTKHRRNLRREREFGERAAQLARDLAAYVDAEVPEGTEHHAQLTTVTITMTLLAGALAHDVTDAMAAVALDAAAPFADG